MKALNSTVVKNMSQLKFSFTCISKILCVDLIKNVSVDNWASFKTTLNCMGAGFCICHSQRSAAIIMLCSVKELPV